MIQQPALGKRILELRKAVDITQEELKDKCHVSVRTIQRIESGIVTPRLSTIRILIEALGENPEDWQSSGTSNTTLGFIKGMLLINTSEDHLKQSFQSAWIFGIVYLLLFLVSVGANALPEEHLLHAPMTLLPVYVLMIIAFAGFMRGYVVLAKLFEIQLLKTGSYLYVFFVALALLADMLEISFSSLEESSGLFSFFTLMLIGTASVIFGMGLLRLQDGMGRLAKVSGRLEIAFGLSYLSIILSFVGLVLLGPVLVLEIVLLAKADQQVRKGQL
ncbi:MAG: helix-turn-helix transcriptional regulator [Cytophagales bacterium]|nr:helix-turn-helix transcriptional regulator [Cytophagales bacterium]